MPDATQTMPSMEAMIKNAYSVQDFLNYYRNIWVRNLAARLIDVETDVVAKGINPEEIVQEGNEEMPVKIRLERRKIYVKDAMGIIAAMDSLIALKEGVMAKTSDAALAVATDMLPTSPTPEAEYKVLKDFGSAKAGDIIKVGPQSTGWTPEGLKQRIDEGTIELVKSDAEQKTPSPEASV